MKKWLAFAVVLMSLSFVKEARADGNYLPVLVVSSVTGQGYAYSNTASASVPGGVLVNNGGGAFNWSSSPITSTNSLTVFQIPALPLLTIAQINALQPATTGQIVMCTNCTGTNVCVSSGSTAVQQFVAVSTSAFASTACH